MKNNYEIRGEVTAIFALQKSGVLREILIDTDDLTKFESIEYAITVSDSRGKLYAVVNAKTKYRRLKYSIHRFLFNPTKEKIVDHINGNGLDNRKANIRLITQAENMQNYSNVYKNNKSSGLRGVTWHKGSQKWRAYARVNKQDHHLGYFEDVNEAAKVVQEWRQKNMPYAN